MLTLARELSISAEEINLDEMATYATVDEMVTETMKEVVEAGFGLFYP